MTIQTSRQVGAPDIAMTRRRIDPARSTVGFRVRPLWGWPPVNGHFTRYEGTLDLSSRPAVELTIATDSVDTNNKKRDTHLRSPAFFDAEQQPSIRFVSESCAFAGDTIKARGRLYARGNSLPLEIDASLRRVGDELEIGAATHADHRHLGMTYGNKLGMLRAASRLAVTGRLVPCGPQEQMGTAEPDVDASPPSQDT